MIINLLIHNNKLTYQQQQIYLHFSSRITHRQIMIFNWISRCWGGMGITTQFEKARINCTIPDWTVPYQNDILILITSFQDKNPQIPSKTAINIFLSHLQTDQQKAHPAFLLKHLYVLDHCIEEMTALDIIGYYYNSNLTTIKSNKTIDISDNRSPLRQLINSYYAYLITKARTFGHYQRTYFSRHLKAQSSHFIESSAHNIQTKTYDDQIMPSQISLPSGGQFDFMCSSGRKKRERSCTQQQQSIYSLFQKQTSYNSIFDVMEKCQQLQKLIMQMNKAYQSGNRKVQLIKYIFIMCLWTFIRCYVIVSVGMKYLFKHFLSMSLKELQRFIKTFQNFNNQYTADFIRFVQSNKNEIQIFKQINYNELTYVNKDGMRILLDYKEQLKSKQAVKTLTSTKKITSMPSIKRVSGQLKDSISIQAVYPNIADEIDDMKILQLPVDVHTRIKENMKIFYKPRKNMDFCLMQITNKIINQPYIYQDHFEQNQLEDKFFNHINFYHEAFIAESTNIEDAVTEVQVNKQKSTASPIKQQTVNKSKQKDKKELGENREQTHELRKRKLSIDKDIQMLKKQQQSSSVSQQIIDIKLTTQKLLGTRPQKRGIQPIKASQMSEIREMFQQKRKGSRKFSAWETWENQYGDNTQLIGTRN